MLSKLIMIVAFYGTVQAAAACASVGAWQWELSIEQSIVSPLDNAGVW
jgi:hypothetical protein